MDPLVGTRGILLPLDGLAHFSLERPPPCPALASFVQWHWLVRWELPGAVRYEQEILPGPWVNLAFEAGRSAVHGPGTRRFVARLEGRGRVVGVKFRPGAYARFSAVPMASLVNRVIPVGEAFGEQARELEAHVLESDDTEAVALVEAFLRGREARADPSLELVSRLVETVRENPALARVEELALEGELSVRSLHRLFERTVGLGPKWVIRCFRVREAAERVALGTRVNWAATALALGYHDQAHLIRDFKEQVGFTPAAYAARCAEAASRTHRAA